MSFVFRHKNSRRIMHTINEDTLRGIDLSNLDLTDADLRNLDFTGAKFNHTILKYANIENATFNDADMCHVDMTQVFARYTNMENAILTKANFTDADMDNINLSGAIMRETDMYGVILSNADLTGADISNAKMDININFSCVRLMGVKCRKNVPVIENIDAKILEQIKKGRNKLDMSDWHTCGTTHCRGGWAIVLAGKAGKALEKKCGTEIAAKLIYAVSRPNMEIPDFFANNFEAMDDLIACAA